MYLLLQEVTHKFSSLLYSPAMPAPCAASNAVLGLAAALLIYVTATPDAIDHGTKLRKAASGVG
jgi:hypothetical protein